MQRGSGEGRRREPRGGAGRGSHEGGQISASGHGGEPTEAGWKKVAGRGGSTGIAPETLQWRLQVLSYPDEQLCEDYVGHCAREMQRRAPVSISVGLVHLLLGAMGQECHHQAQVILHHGPQQLLPQWDVRLRQWGQKELLLILSPDPALLLLPARQDIVTVTVETICLGTMHKRTRVSALPCEHTCVSREHLSHPGMFCIAPAVPLCSQLPLRLCHPTLDTCLTPAGLTAPLYSSQWTLCAYTHARTAPVSCTQTPHLSPCRSPSHPSAACPCCGSSGTVPVPCLRVGRGPWQEKVSAAHASPGPREAPYRCRRLAWCRQRQCPRPSRRGRGARIDVRRPAAICCHSIHLHLAGGHQCPAPSMLTAAAP